MRLPSFRLIPLRAAALLLIGSAVASACAEAQTGQRAPRSERSTVSHVVGDTRVTIDYARPRARGRTLFGGLLKWNEVWTPGANDATTLETSHPVLVGDRLLAKGKYSVWLVLRESGDWTFVLDPRATLFHTQRPDSTAEQLRFVVRPTQEAAMETLTWWFPEYTERGLTIAMQWGTHRVTVPLHLVPRETSPRETSSRELAVRR